jgi:hypothetical protein
VEYIIGSSYSFLYHISYLFSFPVLSLELINVLFNGYRSPQSIKRDHSPSRAFDPYLSRRLAFLISYHPFATILSGALQLPIMPQDYTFEGWMGHDRDSVNGKLVWQEFEPKPWEDTDVDIQITHCGICATDLHTLRSGHGQVRDD